MRRLVRLIRYQSSLPAANRPCALPQVNVRVCLMPALPNTLGKMDPTYTEDDGA